MPDSIEELRNQFLLEDEQFESYYKNALNVLLTNKEKSKHKTLIIVGGQPGAGKTRMISTVNQELNNNAVVVDFDILRQLHPNYQQVSEKHIEKTHIILHPDVDKAKTRAMKYLMKNGYDVIYEGSLKNTQGFIDFSREFLAHEYDISLYIMAVPKLESFGSTYLRYAEDLENNNNPRWVEKIAHDESFEGVLKTVEAFEKQSLCSNTKVFTRGEIEPKEIYSTAGRQFHSTIEAIQYGREIGRRKATEDFWDKYKKVYTVFRQLKPELLDTLRYWEDLFKDEYEKNKKDNKKSLS